MRKMWFLLMFAMVLMAVPSAFAQSNSLYVTGTSCPTNNTYLGHTTVNWSVTSSEPNNVALWVSAGYFGPYSLLAAARSGSQYVDWLSYDTQYLFTLEVGEDSNDDFDSGTGLLGIEVDC